VIVTGNIAGRQASASGSLLVGAPPGDLAGAKQCMRCPAPTWDLIIENVAGAYPSGTALSIFAMVKPWPVELGSCPNLIRRNVTVIHGADAAFRRGIPPLGQLRDDRLDDVVRRGSAGGHSHHSGIG
jgi:hypothetical protein